MFGSATGLGVCFPADVLSGPESSHIMPISGLSRCRACQEVVLNEGIPSASALSGWGPAGTVEGPISELDAQVAGRMLGGFVRRPATTA